MDSFGSQWFCKIEVLCVLSSTALTFLPLASDYLTVILQVHDRSLEVGVAWEQGLKPVILLSWRSGCYPLQSTWWSTVVWTGDHLTLLTYPYCWQGEPHPLFCSPTPMCLCLQGEPHPLFLIVVSSPSPIPTVPLPAQGANFQRETRTCLLTTTRYEYR